MALIGDGYSAAVTAYHLLKHGMAAEDIRIFGPAPLGQGQAYHKGHPSFRLNVRAELMKIDPDQPRDFPQWANAWLDDPEAHTAAGAFYRRRDFARYLTEKLDGVLAGKTLEQIPARVARLTPSWRITTEDGDDYAADTIVLATGNPPPAPALAVTGSGQRVISDPWRGDWRGDIQPDDDVVVIGGGLTAMDAFTALCGSDDGTSQEDAPFRGHVTIITPHGALPAAQLDWAVTPAFIWPEVNTASDFLQVINRQLGKNGWQDPQEQAAFESLRPGMKAAWRQLPLTERRRLITRLGWRWQLLRYRAAPHPWHDIARLQDQGRFTLMRGRATSIASTQSKVTVTLASGQEITCLRALIATGAGHDPLIKRLAEDGHVQHDDGELRIDADLRLCAGNGQAFATAFALGPPTVLSAGDVIGASSIAQQAQGIARLIVASMKEPLK